MKEGKIIKLNKMGLTEPTVRSRSQSPPSTTSDSDTFTFLLQEHFSSFRFHDTRGILDCVT